MVDEPVDIQGRIGTLMDRIEDDFLRDAIGELFTMEKIKWGTATIACKSCGAEGRYRAEIASPDYKGIAYAVKTLLDATGRTKEPPKTAEITQAQLDESVKKYLDEKLGDAEIESFLARLATA